MIDEKGSRGLRWRFLGLVVLLILACVLALAWRLSVLGQSADVQHWVEAIRSFSQTIDPPIVVFIVALVATLAVPLAVILLMCGLSFGPAAGLTYALLGSLLGAGISFLVGRQLGHEALCRLAGNRVKRISVRLGERGILAVIALRLVPIAPFAVVNMVAGTTHIRLRDFLFGSLIGMLPGAGVITFFSDQMISILTTSGWQAWGLAVLTLLLIVGGVVGFRRWFNN